MINQHNPLIVKNAIVAMIAYHDPSKNDPIDAPQVKVSLAS
jgi:hypothetical protein